MAAKVAIAGALTRDPVLQMHDGKTVVYFTVAVRTGMKTRDGEPETNFYNCKMWEKNSKFIGENGKKSNYVAVWGSLSMREYIAPNGVARMELYVVADSTDLLEHPPKTETVDDSDTQTGTQEEPAVTTPEE
jgi:single stranded DNA-binding protein